jgi:signal peptidase I
MKASGSRYRSYRDKKNQSIAFRRYFLRITVVFIFFSFFTSFFALAIRVEGESMAPTFNHGNIVIFHPFKNLASIVGRNSSSGIKRGDLVIAGTAYSSESSPLEKIFDPFVRAFTLQKKSLIYDNSQYKGNTEFTRVIGLPGDTIKLKDFTVYVKGKDQEFFLSEFEVTKMDYDILKPINIDIWKDEYPFSSYLEEFYLGEDEYFVISDNRGILNDSRIYGPLSAKDLKGKVLLKYWPIKEFATF